MCKKTGCCGALSQIILILVNVIVFIIGAAMFVIGALLKWSDLLNEIRDEISSTVGDLNQYIDYLSIFFLVLGAIIMAVALTGIVGACCTNRCFLVIYIIILGFVFLIHLGGFIAFLVYRSELKSLVVDAISSIINDIIGEASNNPGATTEQIAAFSSCNTYDGIAEFFKCCDFNLTTQAQYVTACCTNTIEGTCPDRIYSFIDSYIIILPNSVLIAFEFILIVLVIVLIVKLSNYHSRKQKDMEMGYYRR